MLSTALRAAARALVDPGALARATGRADALAEQLRTAVVDLQRTRAAHAAALHDVVALHRRVQELERGQQPERLRELVAALTAARAEIDRLRGAHRGA